MNDLASKLSFANICQPNHKQHYLLNKRDSLMYNITNVSMHHSPILKTERYEDSFTLHN